MKKEFAVVILLFSVLLVPPVISGLEIEDYSPTIEAEPEKKRAGDSINFGDGYILLIKNVNPGDGKVSIELQLDDRTIDDKILRKGEFYESEKYNGVPILIEVVDIYHEATGDYVILEIMKSFAMASAHFDLIISSVPQGAEIWIDGKYTGKTSKTIPILDFDVHSLRLELEGYEDAEQNFQFESDKAEKDVLITLNRIQLTPTPTPTLVPQTSSPTPATPTPAPTLVPQTSSPTPATPTPAIPTTTLVPHTYSPSPTPPGFLAIADILAILCVFLILKRKHS